MKTEKEKKKKPVGIQAAPQPMPSRAVFDSALPGEELPQTMSRRGFLAQALTLGALSLAELTTLSNQIFYSGKTVKVKSAPKVDLPVLEFPNGMTLTCGVYLMPAVTGGGKTEMSLALVGYANESGIPADHLYVFEPRSEPVSLKGIEDDSLFLDARRFITADLPKVVANTSGGKMGLLVVDSITDPLKAHAASGDFKDQPTFKGGMQPSDRDFLIRMCALAYKHKLVIIATINSQLIDYISALAGAAEGYFKIEQNRGLMVNDRSKQSKRKFVEFSIPERYSALASQYTAHDPSAKTWSSTSNNKIGL